MKLHTIHLTAFVVILLGITTACSVTDEEDTGYFYPSVVTELAELETNESGKIYKIINDGGETFHLVNPRSGYQPKVVYRALVGYEVTSRSASRSEAYLRNLHDALLLRDSTERPRQADPVKVVSTWRAGNYINLMLAPRTQGGKQWWGYRVDSLRHRYGGWHLFVSLHHSQNGDPASYTETEYASLYVKKLPEYDVPIDSLSFKAVTPEGLRCWGFKY